MSHYYEGLNLKLLAAIPADAKRVLELGCANGRLGQRFKEDHPQVAWWGVDCSAEAVATASAHLDRVFTLDLDAGDLTAVGRDFDVIVIGDLLEHLRRPEAVLSTLYDLCAEGAHIICCLPNMAHLSVIQRLVVGDISYDENGLLDRTHSRFFSLASAFKTFLDAGWLPDLRDQYRVEAPDNAFAACIVDAAEALGLPRKTAMWNLGIYQMIIVCRKWPMHFLARPSRSVPFSVIVPTNRPWQYELNIARSPGLAEVQAEVIMVHGASSAADAYRSGAARASHAWRVMVHQDVYFPVGSGYALAQKLGALEQAGACELPVGFAGIENLTGAGERPTGPLRRAGMVIDRHSLFAHGPSASAVSLDEFAVALHERCAVQIDARLGWHLWATDLCLQIRELAQQPIAQIIDVPLFHNSTNDFTLPSAFEASAAQLLAKYPKLARIPTLCGEIERPRMSAAFELS